MDQENLKQELIQFYMKYNPENIHKIDEIINTFRGREDILCLKLNKKYGASPNIYPVHSKLNDKDSNNSNIKISKTDVNKNSDENENKNKNENKLIFDERYVPFVPVINDDNDLNNPYNIRCKSFNPMDVFQYPNKIEKYLKPDTYPLDNIEKCRYLLPEKDPLHLKKKEEKDHSIVVYKIQTKKSDQSKTENPIIQLIDNYLKGPFSLLRDCFYNKEKITVMIRRVNSIRGICEGYLIAFDKHMNMVLASVTETYLPYDIYEERIKKKVKNPYFFYKYHSPLSLYNLKELNNKENIMETKFYKRLLIRGDNIVLINPIKNK